MDGHGTMVMVTNRWNGGAFFKDNSHMTCRTLFGRWCSASGLSSDRRCCKFALCDKPPRDRILTVLLANTASVCRCL